MRVLIYAHRDAILHCYGFSPKALQASIKYEIFVEKEKQARMIQCQATYYTPRVKGYSPQRDQSWMRCRGLLSPLTYHK